MTDKQFLIWIHERLEHVHGEKPIVDYMHKLRAIINSIDSDKVTPNLSSSNSIEELMKGLD